MAYRRAVHAAIPGFFTGLSLIVAIGAQNAFLLRLGLARNHIFTAVAICAISDALLIILGIGGLGVLVEQSDLALEIVKWVGVTYLVIFALRSFWKARFPDSLVPSEQTSRKLSAVIAATLAFTFLNPHVYLDTVLLVGSIGNQYGPDRWWFALGAVLASAAWFTSLGFGSRALAPLMSRTSTWRVLDTVIGVVMLLIAARLIFGDLH
ncbi:MAG: LysE family transporter [Candidatus Nanopelagicales bacterium]|nr:LysE family transporter [Candidatus Nanopelagicales bacterium]